VNLSPNTHQSTEPLPLRPRPAVAGWTDVMDIIFMLSLDLRTSHSDPTDPMAVTARWMWHELKARQRRRAEARTALERAPADSPRLKLS